MFFQRLNLLFFGLETRFHLLGAMSQNLLGFLEIFDLKLLAVELRFFLLQIFLNVLLHVLKYRDLIQIGLLGQLQFFCCLALVFSFFSIHLPFLLQSIFLPFKCFHVSFELSNDLFKLLNFLHLFVFNRLNFAFLLFHLHVSFNSLIMRRPSVSLLLDSYRSYTRYSLRLNFCNKISIACSC